MSGYFQRLAHRAAGKAERSPALSPEALRRASVEPVRDPFEAADVEPHAFVRQQAPRAMPLEPTGIEMGAGEPLGKTADVRTPDAIQQAHSADLPSALPVAREADPLEPQPVPAAIERSTEPLRVEARQTISPPEHKLTIRPERDRVTLDHPVTPRETNTDESGPRQEPEGLQRIEESLSRLMALSDAQKQPEVPQVAPPQHFAPVDVSAPVLNPVPLIAPREGAKVPVEESDDEPRLVIGRVRVDVAPPPRQIERETVRVEHRASPAQSRGATTSAPKLQFGLGQM